MSSYPDAPGHRNVDTSIAAANVLAHAAIMAAKKRGLTADELAVTLGMDRYSIQPRTSELRRKGLIRDSGQRRRNSSGKAAIVWVAAIEDHTIAKSAA